MTYRAWHTTLAPILITFSLRVVIVQWRTLLGSEVITTLLEAGADISAVDKEGKTELMWASWRNQNPEVITLLLNAGADGKAKDRQGKTAFDCAQDNKMLIGTDALKKLEEASK